MDETCAEKLWGDFDVDKLWEFQDGYIEPGISLSYALPFTTLFLPPRVTKTLNYSTVLLIEPPKTPHSF